MAIVAAWFAKRGEKIISWALIALAVLAIVLGVRKSGKDAVRREQLEEDLEESHDVIEQHRKAARIDARPAGGWNDVVDRL